MRGPLYDDFVFVWTDYGVHVPASLIYMGACDYKPTAVVDPMHIGPNYNYTFIYI